MTLLLLSTVKVSAILAVALVAAALLRRRSAAVRHWVLVVAIALAMVLPVLQPIAPSWTLGLASPDVEPARALEFLIVGPDAPAAPTEAPAREPRWHAAVSGVTRLVVPVWLAGMAVSVGLLLLALARLRSLDRGATTVREGAWPRLAEEVSREYDIRRVALLQTTHPALLVTWGWRRPRVLLPAGADEWPDARVRLVLRHEVAHVQRGDWIAQMLGELLRSLYWFDPLVWIACRRLRQESEQACDDRVLRDGIDAPAYAAELLAIARAFDHHSRPWTPVPAAARPSTLHRRIRAMLMPHLDRRPVTGPLRIIAGLGMLIVTLAAAGLGSGSVTVAAAAGGPSARPSPGAEPPAAAAVTAAAPAAPTQVPAAAADPRSSDAAPLQPAGAAPAATSVLSGILLDSSGARLPGVRVSLSRSRDGQREVRSTVSDDSGAFRLTEIPPGEHNLELMLPGFASVVRRVSVQAGASAHSVLMLQVGSLQETVTVGQHEAPLGTVTAEQNRAAEAIRDAVARAPRDPITAPDGLMAPRLPGRPVRVGGNIQAARKTTDVLPTHPVAGPGADGGVVALQARIGENGRIEAVLPLWSSSEDLTVAASAAVWQWEFTPTRLNGRPIAVDMFVTVNFSGG